MTFETLMISFASGLFVIVCGLLVYIFTDMKKEITSFREMLDLKLTQLGHALEIINKDLREIISDTDKSLRSELTILDRRTTHLEAETHSRREGDSK